MSLLIFVLLTVHLISAHLASAGPLVAALFEWRGVRRQEVGYLADGRRIAGASLVALLFTVLFGGSLAIVHSLQGVDYTIAWRQFPHRITWGVVELTMSALLMALYRGWYPHQFGRGAVAACCHRLLAVASAANLIYHIPPLLSAIADVSRGQLALVNEDLAVKQWILSTQAQVKTLHFALAALFVAGIWGTVLAKSSGSVTTAARLAAGAIVLQWPAGFWLVTTLELSQQRRLMGGSPLHTALLVGGLAASVIVLFQLLELANEPDSRRQRGRVAVTAACLVMAMTGLLT